MELIADLASALLRLAGYLMVLALLPVALLGAALSAALAWLTPMTYDQAGALWALIFCVAFWAHVVKRVM